MCAREINFHPFPHMHEFSFNGICIRCANASRYGLLFGLAYVASYMLVAMGIFNVILAVYATWKMPVTCAFWKGTKSIKFVWSLQVCFLSFDMRMVVIDSFVRVI